MIFAQPSTVKETSLVAYRVKMVMTCLAACLCSLFSSCSYFSESSVKQADITAMACFKDFVGKEVKLTRPLTMMVRKPGLKPDIPQLFDTSIEVPSCVRHNQTDLDFSSLPAGTLIRVDRIVYTEHDHWDPLTNRKDDVHLNRMTAYISFKHPETQQWQQAYYHLGSFRDSIEDALGAVIWQRFKHLPWDTSISDKPFFSAQTLRKKEVKGRLKSVPYKDYPSMHSPGRVVPNPRGFDGYDISNCFAYNIVKNTPNCIFSLKVDDDKSICAAFDLPPDARSAYLSLEIRPQRKAEVMELLRKLKTLEQETNELCPLIITFNRHLVETPYPRPPVYIIRIEASTEDPSMKPLLGYMPQIFTVKEIKRYFFVK